MNLNQGWRRSEMFRVSSNARRLALACVFCADSQSEVQRTMEGMDLWQWAGRVALVAIPWIASPDPSGPQAADFLDPQEAFKFSAVVADGNRTIAAHFSIADGYYLYRERFDFAASDGVLLGTPQYPPAKIKFDETFNKDVLTYRGDVVVTLPVESGSGPFTLTAKLQGCADRGLCYPPEQRTAHLLVTAASNAPVAPPSIGTASTGFDLVAPTEEGGRVDSALRSGSFLTVLPIFFALGLLLSFTPCVLPMVPILASIIVGKGVSLDKGGGHGPTRMRGFVLAFAYALGMAIVYTALGVAAGLAGEGLAAALQQPWMLALFAVLLVSLALSMFGFYELQLPSGWQTRLAQASQRRSGGTLAGVFAMGAISALIVGPCVTAPLAGALLYISQTHDVVIGGSALFAMAAGMSAPLLLVGVSAGSLLPRAGRWMESVKRLFGVLLIAVALWTVSPVTPAWAQMLGWAALFIVTATYLYAVDTLPTDASGWQRLGKGVGLLLLVLGAVQIVGAASGGRDVLRPLEQVASAAGNPDTGSPAWRRVESIDALDAALISANGTPVVLDFYAEWCASCKEMDRFTFTDPRVAAGLASFRLLRVDVTANSDRDKALLKRFHLFGPPATIFFDGQGREIPGARVIGFEPAKQFLAGLARALRPATGPAA